jgi:hypothetical protein
MMLRGTRTGLFFLSKMIFYYPNPREVDGRKPL